MGGKLFLKVFLAFWLVSCAVLGSWMLTSEYFASRPVQALEDRPGAGPRPHRFIPHMIYNLQTTPRESLAATVKATRERDGIDIFLLDERGADLLGREVPKDVAYVADRLQGARRRAYFSAPHGHLIAHDLYRGDMGPLRAVFYLPQRDGRILNTLGGNPLLRIGLAV
ncbi:MAG: hypothetical protein KDI09_01005, partial [Halioglobus sp.]|nr:hypothetical protein [Halioglobus sp.]